MSEPGKIQGEMPTMGKSQSERVYNYSGIVIDRGRRKALTRELAESKVDEFFRTGKTEFVTPDGYQLHDDVRKRIEDSGVDYDMDIKSGKNNSLVYTFKRK